MAGGSIRAAANISYLSPSEILRLPVGSVSIKATTTEGLRFIGRAEGLAALAVVLMAESDER